MTAVEIRSFDELGLQELYDILALRTDVFVVEQECAYPELDYHDQCSVHVLLKQGKGLLAYARIAAPGSVYNEPSIGRVAVRVNERGKAYGHQVFSAALEQAGKLYPRQQIRIQAQCYLEEFYKSFGFKTISEAYPDFGVMHVDMSL